MSWSKSVLHFILLIVLAISAYSASYGELCEGTCEDDSICTNINGNLCNDQYRNSIWYSKKFCACCKEDEMWESSIQKCIIDKTNDIMNTTIKKNNSKRNNSIISINKENNTFSNKYSIKLKDIINIPKEKLGCIVGYCNNLDYNCDGIKDRICKPKKEICHNKIDDDKDGVIDDGCNSKEICKTCGNGFFNICTKKECDSLGECSYKNKYLGLKRTCTGKTIPLQGVQEVCNGIDDDNDGSIDNNCKLLNGTFKFIISDGHGHLLPNIKVMFINNSNRTIINTSDHGYFYLNFSNSNIDLFFTVFYEDSENTIRVLDISDPIGVGYPFNLTKINPISNTIHLSFPKNRKDHYDDMAQNYFYFKQTIDFFHDILKVNDSKPGKSDEGDYDDKLPLIATAFVPGITAHYDYGFGIRMSNVYSKVNSNDAPNVHRHELSHHLMYDLMQKFPIKINLSGWVDKNHNSFNNPSSSDSYVEGFAEFMVLVINDYEGRNRPDIYDRYVGSIELNSNLVKLPEEFQVAGLLWDIYDDFETNDFTKNIDDDNISININKIIKILFSKYDLPNYYNQSCENESVKTCLRFPYFVSDLHQIFNLTYDVDDIFINHGFFIDNNKNGFYDDGDIVGRPKENSVVRY